MKCPTCGREDKRSNDQNSRYWKLVSLLAEKPVNGILYSIDSWHTYLKFKFLGADEVKLPNGKAITQPKSTADLDKAEFSNFMTEFEVWCNDHNIWLAE